MYMMSGPPFKRKGDAVLDRRGEAVELMGASAPLMHRLTTDPLFRGCQLVQSLLPTVVSACQHNTNPRQNYLGTGGFLSRPPHHIAETCAAGVCFADRVPEVGNAMSEAAAGFAGGHHACCCKVSGALETF